MDTCIRTQHKEYAAPSNLDNGDHLPLPAKVWDSMQIHSKEYIGCRIEKLFIPPPFN